MLVRTQGDVIIPAPSYGLFDCEDSGTVTKRSMLLTYVGLVGLPLLALMGVLRAGAHLKSPTSVGGPWNVDADFSSLAGTPCGALLSGVRQPALAIIQSGRQLTLNLNNSQKTALAATLDGSTVRTTPTAGSGGSQSTKALTPGCDYPQSIQLEATISSQEPRTMTGMVSLSDCSDCKPVSFHAVRETAQQDKSQQQLVPRVVTIIIQIAVIIIAVRAFGFLFKFIRQPQVVGEMVAGILLGPSLLGWVAPHFSSILFPVASLDYLNTISQIGIVIYMFLVGLALNPESLKGHRHAAVLTSHVSIVVPFLLGTVLAFFLYPKLSDDSVGLTSFALFIGAALSITAFPVLARILADRNMLGSRVGTLAIACAAVDDVTGWCILAYVLIRTQGGSAAPWLMIAGALAFVLGMVYVVKPLLRRFQTAYERNGRLSENAVALLILLVLLSALITERLGIHLVFGAFLVGAVMPKEPGFSRHIQEKFESLTVVLLLPLYFAFSGLRMNLQSIKGGQMWLYCGIIILVAIVGKLVGSTIATRSTGISWRDATAVGILMNARGLLGLVILNIGLDVGVISPVLFSMMVLMALVTTFMASPLLEWVYPSRLIREEIAADLKEHVTA
jgi:Kef-type K+ transport system membrane component KefB